MLDKNKAGQWRSDHYSVIREGLPEEATFEMRAKQQEGASWAEVRVEGAQQRGQQVQRPGGRNGLGLLNLCKPTTLCSQAVAR